MMMVIISLELDLGILQHPFFLFVYHLYLIVIHEHILSYIFFPLPFLPLLYGHGLSMALLLKAQILIGGILFHNERRLNGHFLLHRIEMSFIMMEL